MRALMPGPKQVVTHRGRGARDSRTRSKLLKTWFGRGWFGRLVTHRKPRCVTIAAGVLGDVDHRGPVSIPGLACEGRPEPGRERGFAEGKGDRGGGSR